MSEHITHSPQIKRLERSSDRVLAGVASGLGRYFELNPAVFRLGFVILALLGGAGVLVYLAAVLVIPEEGKDQSIAAEVLAERRERPWPVVGLGLAGVALVLLLSRGDVWPAAGAGWIFVLAGGLAIVWASRRQKRARRILIAVTALLTLVVVAATIAVVAAFAVFNVSLGDGVGNRTYAPATAGDVRAPYKLGIGTLKVNLSQLEPASTQHVRARLGIGELKIVVPRDASVHVNAHARAGELFVLHNHDDGTNATVHTGHGQLRVDARVGAGRIDVVRAG